MRPSSVSEKIIPRLSAGLSFRLMRDVFSAEARTLDIFECVSPNSSDSSDAEALPCPARKCGRL